MKYRTQKSVIEDYHNGKISEKVFTDELSKVVEYQRAQKVKRQTKRIYQLLDLRKQMNNNK